MVESTPRTSYPERTEATKALVLGIFALVLPRLGPFAWFFGNREVKAIDAGRRDPANRTPANVGRIIGMIITILGLIGLAFFALLAIILVLGN